MQTDGVSCPGVHLQGTVWDLRTASLWYASEAIHRLKHAHCRNHGCRMEDADLVSAGSAPARIDLMPESRKLMNWIVTVGDIKSRRPYCHLFPYL